MSRSIDTTMKSLRLEKEDLPLNLPDLPEFCSSERNTWSLMDMILNPDHQRVSDVVLDMPRKWQISDKVRGVVLSRDRFQFIFKFEHDLEEVFKKKLIVTIKCRLSWSVGSKDLLQIIFNTLKLGSSSFGEFARQVVEVAFDSEKTQSREYVRVKVRLDVSKSVRRSKVVNLPNGESISILYDFERIQRKCYACQRLTHDQDKCPLFQSRRRRLRTKQK